MSHWTPHAYAEGSQQPAYYSPTHNPQSRSRDMSRQGQSQLSGGHDSYPSQAMTAAQLAMQSSGSHMMNGTVSPKMEDTQAEQYHRARQPSRSAYAQPPSSAMSVRPIKSEHEESYYVQQVAPNTSTAMSSPYPQNSAGTEKGPFSPAQSSRASPTRLKSQQLRYDTSTPSFSQLNSPRTPGTIDPSTTSLNPLHYSNNGFNQSSDSPRMFGSATGLPQGPVPQFKRLKSSHDLDPLINVQPQFRRANPEGGFISVC